MSAVKGRKKDGGEDMTVQEACDVLIAECKAEKRKAKASGVPAPVGADEKGAGWEIILQLLPLLLEWFKNRKK